MSGKQPHSVHSVTSKRTEIYAYAAALLVDASAFLGRMHEVAGGPSRREGRELDGREQRLAGAAAAGYSAVAACSALGARLLLVERDAVARDVADAPLPSRAEFGVTHLDPDERALVEGLRRSVDASADAVEVAANSWRALDDAAGLLEQLSLLRSHLDGVAPLLDVQWPEQDAQATRGSTSARRP